MKVRKRIDRRIQALPKELRDTPVAFAAASLIGPLFIVLVALAAGQSEVSSPLYSVAAIVFVVGVAGFLVTSFSRLRARRAEDAWLEEERTRRRQTRRVSAASMSRSRMSEERRAS
jgi:beta-lactamase regulating signal transducer with metallopeptidase domain